MIDIEKLEACPFCDSGDTDLYNDTEPDDSRNWTSYVECNNCGARSAGFRKPDGAIAGWNCRSAPAAGTVEKDAAHDCRKIGGDVAVIISQSTAQEALDAMKAQKGRGKYQWLMADDASFVAAIFKELEAAIEAHNKAGKEQG